MAKSPTGAKMSPTKDMYWFAHGGELLPDKCHSSKNAVMVGDQEDDTTGQEQNGSPSRKPLQDRKAFSDETKSAAITKDSAAPQLDGRENSPVLSQREREDRVHTNLERQDDEKQQRLNESKRNQSQKNLEEVEDDKRKRTGSSRAREEKRIAVEGRKKQLMETEQEKNEAILKKNMEREAALEARRNAQRSNLSFAFGSSLPRNLNLDVPTIYQGSDLDRNKRRTTSAYSLSQKTEEKEKFAQRLNGTSSQDMKMNSASFVNSVARRKLFGDSSIEGHSSLSNSTQSDSEPHIRKSARYPPNWLIGSGAIVADDTMSQSMTSPTSVSRGRRKTDLTPTIPYDRTGPPRTTTPSASSSKRSVSMSRLDQLAQPRRHYVEAHRESVKANSSSSSAGKDVQRSPSRPRSSMSAASEQSGGSSRVSSTAPVNLRPRSAPRKPRPVSIAGTVPDRKSIVDSKRQIRSSRTPEKKNEGSNSYHKAAPVSNLTKSPRPKSASSERSSHKMLTTRSTLSKNAHSVKPPITQKQVAPTLASPTSAPSTNIAEEDKSKVSIGSPTRSASPDVEVSNISTGDDKSPGKRIISEEEARTALAERRRLAREQAEKEAELERQRQEELRRQEEERLRREEEEQRRMEEEHLRLIEEHRKHEEEKLKKAIEEQEKREEEEKLKREEEVRLKYEKEEQEKKAREEAERQRIELEEKLKKEEVERAERKKRLEKIMSRTRGKTGASSSSSQSGSDQLDSLGSQPEVLSSDNNSLDSNITSEMPCGTSLLENSQISAPLNENESANSHQIMMASSSENPFHNNEIMASSNENPFDSNEMMAHSSENPSLDSNKIIPSAESSLDSNQMMIPSNESISLDSTQMIIPSGGENSLDSNQMMLPSSKNVLLDSNQLMILPSENDSLDSNQMMLPSSENDSLDSNQMMLPSSENDSLDSNQMMLPSSENVSLDSTQVISPCNEISSINHLTTTESVGTAKTVASIENASLHSTEAITQSAENVSDSFDAKQLLSNTDQKITPFNENIMNSNDVSFLSENTDNLTVAPSNVNTISNENLSFDDNIKTDASSDNVILEGLFVAPISEGVSLSSNQTEELSRESNSFYSVKIVAPSNENKCVESNVSLLPSDGISVDIDSSVESSSNSILSSEPAKDPSTDPFCQTEENKAAVEANVTLIIQQEASGSCTVSLDNSKMLNSFEDNSVSDSHTEECDRAVECHLETINDVGKEYDDISSGTVKVETNMPSQMFDFSDTIVDVKVNKDENHYQVLQLDKDDNQKGESINIGETSVIMENISESLSEEFKASDNTTKMVEIDSSAIACETSSEPKMEGGETENSMHLLGFNYPTTNGEKETSGENEIHCSSPLTKVDTTDVISSVNKAEKNLVKVDELELNESFSIHSSELGLRSESYQNAFDKVPIVESEDSSLDSNLSQIMNYAEGNLVPEDSIGLGTIHGITDNGHPVNSGALQMKNNNEIHFVSSDSQKQQQCDSDYFPRSNGYAAHLNDGLTNGTRVDADSNKVDLIEQMVPSHNLQHLGQLLDYSVNTNILPSVDNHTTSGIDNVDDVNFNRLSNNPFLETEESNRVPTNPFLTQEDNKQQTSVTTDLLT